MRPTFGQISELIIAAIPEGAELRPAARIKNKHPLRRAMLPSLPDSPSTSDRESGSPTKLDQSYRDKFRSRSKTQMDKSYRVEEAASPPPTPPPPRTNPDSHAGALFQTFSDTLISTFTPDKGR
jgi:hypothetical protein